MTATRTSNKQILEAIESQTQAITALVGALSGNTVAQAPIPVLEAAEPVQNETPKDNTLKLNKDEQRYLAHMTGKFEAYATKISEPVVGYAYTKSNGKTGFWSVPQSQWTDKKSKIKNLIGPIGIYQA